MAQNKNNNKNGGDCCSFCGAKRTDVEIMFQGSDGANICNKCIENGYKIIVDNDIASERGRRPAAAPLKMEELLKLRDENGVLCGATEKRTDGQIMSY